jgi:hypothetical protein
LIEENTKLKIENKDKKRKNEIQSEFNGDLLHKKLQLTKIEAEIVTLDSIKSF